MGIVRQFKPKCPHNAFKYDEASREIFCDKCDKLLDPIVVVQKVFGRMMRMEDQLKTHMVEMDKLNRRKRVKCRYCNRFTDIKLNASFTEKYRTKVREPNQSE